MCQTLDHLNFIQQLEHENAQLNGEVRRLRQLVQHTIEMSQSELGSLWKFATEDFDILEELIRQNGENSTDVNTRPVIGRDKEMESLRIELNNQRIGLAQLSAALEIQRNEAAEQASFCSDRFRSFLTEREKELVQAQQKLFGAITHLEAAAEQEQKKFETDLHALHSKLAQSEATVFENLIRHQERETALVETQRQTSAAHDVERRALEREIELLCQRQNELERMYADSKLEIEELRRLEVENGRLKSDLEVAQRSLLLTAASEGNGGSVNLLLGELESEKRRSASGRAAMKEIEDALRLERKRAEEDRARLDEQFLEVVGLQKANGSKSAVIAGLEESNRQLHAFLAQAKEQHQTQVLSLQKEIDRLKEEIQQSSLREEDNDDTQLRSASVRDRLMPTAHMVTDFSPACSPVLGKCLKLWLPCY